MTVFEEMELRDLFAGLFAATICSHQEFVLGEWDDQMTELSPAPETRSHWLADQAYYMADRMMERRKER